MRRPTGPGKITDNLALPPSARQGVDALLFNFDIDDATVKTEHQAWLRANAVPLLAGTNAVASLTGSASRSGADNYNQALSQRRVQAVRSFLLGEGAREGQFTATAIGESGAALAGRADGSEDERDRAVLLAIRFPPRTRAMRFERLDPTDREDGFESTRTPQWLMVPLFDRRVLELRNGAGVQLFVDNPGVVQLVSPRTGRPANDLPITTDRETVTFQGNLPGDARVLARDFRTGAVTVLLEISVLFPLSVRIATHLITDPQHPTPGRGNGASVQTMLDEARRLYLRQANIVLVSTGPPQLLRFTTNLSDPAAPPRNGIQPITKNTVGGETFPTLSARGNASARINVFYVWEWEPDDPDTQAEADGIPGRNVIFEDDISAVINGALFNNPGLTLTHEFGHCLGLEHTGTANPALAERVMFDRSNRRGLINREEILRARQNA